MVKEGINESIVMPRVLYGWGGWCVNGSNMNSINVLDMKCLVKCGVRRVY